jgi:hypothetical protein
LKVALAVTSRRIETIRDIQTKIRHGRACRGHPRAFAFYGARTRAIVDGPNKSGHDDWDETAVVYYR